MDMDECLPGWIRLIKYEHLYLKYSQYSIKNDKSKVSSNS